MEASHPLKIEKTQNLLKKKLTMQQRKKLGDEVNDEVKQNMILDVML